MGGGGFSLLPPVLKFLIISNVAIFLGQLVLGAFHFGEFSVGDYLDAYLPLYPSGHPLFFPWQFVTYMYMHGGFMHVFLNMLMLYFFGLEVEQALGAKRFFLFYTLCGIGGGVAHWLISSAPVVGASGAVFGVMVAFAMLYPDRTIYYFMFPIPAKYMVGIYVLINLYGGISGGGTVAYFAHLGGALVGVVYFLAIMGKFPFNSGGFSNNRNRMGGGSGGRGGNQDYWQAFQNPWEQAQRKEEASRRPSNGFGNMFKRPNRDDDETIDAEYYDVNDQRNRRSSPSQDQPTHNGRVITQEEIDRILDKIAASGYSNLTEDERQILFEASKKMDERR
jgi:membrane associated rhomboid family serine protease